MIAGPGLQGGDEKQSLQDTDVFSGRDVRQAEGRAVARMVGELPRLLGKNGKKSRQAFELVDRGYIAGIAV